MAKTITKSHKYVYLFGNKKADGNGGMKPLLGGKGANLAEMTRIGLPVPPGFTITTEVCALLLRPQILPQGNVGAGQGRHRQHREASSANVSATSKSPSWSPSVPARAIPCRA